MNEVANTKVKSVKELTLDIKNLLENEFAFVWVKGEVGPVKVHSSGHRYFSLKEDEHVISAICWRGTPISATLEEGVIVECYGKITIYPGRSSYQIVVKEVKEINKQGNILFQLEELKKKLVQEGVFDLNKKEIPKFPSKIAVMTSPTGAVLHDIIHRIDNRYPCCQVLFFPIPVQGSDAKPAILKALRKVEEFEVDTVILARGGGSLEDLWVFNDEEIVRAVANLRHPIISAIGHETDTTLVDFAASLRAPTPTAAAELATPDKIDLQNIVTSDLLQSQQYIQSKIFEYQKFIDNFNDHQYLYKSSIESFCQRIDNFIITFTLEVREKLKDAERKIGTLDFLRNFVVSLQTEISQRLQSASEVAKFKIERFNEMMKQENETLESKEKELQTKVFIKKGSVNLYSATELKKVESDFSIHFLDGIVRAVKKNGE